MQRSIAVVGYGCFAAVPESNSMRNVPTNAAQAQKQHIGPGKQHIEPKKLHIDGLNISAPTRKNILSLYAELKSVSSLGRKDVCRITGLSPRVASTLLSWMLTFKLIISISGHGKIDLYDRLDGRSQSEAVGLGNAAVI